MPLSTQHSDDGRTVTLRVDGSFDFSLHADFRAAYRNMAPSIHFIVDLSRTTYMDSSALGMLLLLREHTSGRTGAVQIVNASRDIRNIFEIAKLDRMFQIS